MPIKTVYAHPNQADCPLCGSSKVEHIHTFGPTSSTQQIAHKTLAAAMRERAVFIELTQCRACGFVFNRAFDEGAVAYAEEYVATQAVSPVFYRFLESLAGELVRRMHLKDKRVLEIGCGDGAFLGMLRARGVRRLQGYDPSYQNHDPDIDRLVAKHRFGHVGAAARYDVIIARHLLEHIPAPVEFLENLKRHLAPRGALYIEVPDFGWSVRNAAVFDFSYEHCNYFTRATLLQCLERAGFKPLRLSRRFAQTYISVEATKSTARDGRTRRAPTTNGLKRMIVSETEKLAKTVRTLRRFTMWGAGGKCVSLAHFFGASRARCPFVIDINPAKHHRFVPLTGQEILSPDVLKRRPVEVIVIMNPAYEHEIKRAAGALGYRGRFITLSR